MSTVQRSESMFGSSRSFRSSGWRWRTVASGAARAACAVSIGALMGLVVAVDTPAHLKIVGGKTSVWLDFGKSYDQIAVRGLVTLDRATSRSLAGEPLGIRAVLDLDTAQLVNGSGQFDTRVLPAYIQAYSDPTQIVSAVRSALVSHLLLFTLIGAGAGLAASAARPGYRRWRASYDRRHWPDGATRAAALAYRRPERRAARRVAQVAILVVAAGALPSAVWHSPSALHVRPDALFDGTPLAGTEVHGLLRPAMYAVRDSIRTYFGETDTYYSRLADKLTAQLASSPVQLPAGDDVVSFGFVTDRHCNIGMDRVVVALLRTVHVHLLVSGGDDAFSGSFSFESACTSGLADRSAKAGITDIFVAGNHDSAKSMAAERDAGIHTLDGGVIEAEGLRFLGLPDPRTSRYGEGIQPASSAAQHAVLDEQGRRVAQLACAQDSPVIAVLHDPRAGAEALSGGCGKVSLALDGHTHAQDGPTPFGLPGGRTGYRFVGASAGGAPSETTVVRTFASRLTVGPLNHDASVEIVSVHSRTGQLAGVTVLGFTPKQEISISKLTAG